MIQSDSQIEFDRQLLRRSGRREVQYDAFNHGYRGCASTAAISYMLRCHDTPDAASRELSDWLRGDDE